MHDTIFLLVVPNVYYSLFTTGSLAYAFAYFLIHRRVVYLLPTRITSPMPIRCLFIFPFRLETLVKGISVYVRFILRRRLVSPYNSFYFRSHAVRRASSTVFSVNPCVRPEKRCKVTKSEKKHIFGRRIFFFSIIFSNVIYLKQCARTSISSRLHN